jgi:hypothetical protein
MRSRSSDLTGVRVVLVARHQPAGRDIDHVPIAPNPDRGHGQLFGGSHCTFNTELLVEAQYRVERDEDQDGTCSLQSPWPRDDRGGDKDDEHQPDELLPQDESRPLETAFG